MTKVHFLGKDILIRSHIFLCIFVYMLSKEQSHPIKGGVSYLDFPYFINLTKRQLNMFWKRRQTQEYFVSYTDRSTWMGFLVVDIAKGDLFVTCFQHTRWGVLNFETSSTRLQICPLYIFGNKATDGTYRSKYWFPGFGGLIQGQIYNPVLSSTHSCRSWFWRPSEILVAHCSMHRSGCRMTQKPGKLRDVREVSQHRSLIVMGWGMPKPCNNGIILISLRDLS